jgi:hypothetical protein
MWERAREGSRQVALTGCHWCSDRVLRVTGYASCVLLSLVP